MKRGTAIASAGALLALGLLSGVPSAGAKEKLNSFAGSCSVQGTVYFSPPATFTQQELKVVYDATGTCSGTLNGESVSDAPVKLHQRGHSYGSCLGAQTTEPGHGTITFADGTVIPYGFTFQAVGSEIFFSFTGQRSGTAHGHGTFNTDRTPPDAITNCAGKGDASVPMDMSLSTDSPLVSKRAGGD